MFLFELELVVLVLEMLEVGLGFLRLAELVMLMLGLDLLVGFFELLLG